MASQVPLIIADFETQISGSIAAGDTSFTLASATDDDGNALAAGKYCFTVNNGRSNKQYLIGQLNGTAVTSVKTVDRRGNETSGAQYSARSGSPVMISDFAALQRVADILRGQVDLDGSNPISYDAEPTLVDREELATVGYVLDNVSGGTVDFDNQIITGVVAGETIAAGDWVFFNTADQEWYLIDADTAAEVDGAYIGVALGSGTDGVSITGGIQISGVYTTTGLTAGSVYYLSNTAGDIGTSAGTTERAIGVALSTTKLLLNFQEKQLPTANEKAGMSGVNNPPSATNPLVTTNDLSDPTFKPTQVVVFTSSGTWTKDDGLKYIIVEGVGGGGGCDSDVGDDDAGSGAGYFRKLILASALGATETVTIGAAGASNSVAASATNGGATSFGAHCTANGGTKSAGAGGTATGGDINITGQRGFQGSSGTGANYEFGGGSMLGLGGSHPSGYGAGACVAQPATPGIVIVTEHYV